MELETELRHALSRNELQLHYQSSSGWKPAKSSAALPRAA
jgi:hypothetical protein